MNAYNELKKLKALNLRRYMEMFHLSQRQVADILDTYESNVSDMKNGKRTISDHVISILCNSASPAFFFED
jgi:predicted transcriptional regulator